MSTLVVLVGVCLAAVPGFDDPVLYPPEVYPGEELTAGEIQVESDDPSGVKPALVLEHTSIVAEITGGLARVTMIQWFHNPYEEPISATYLLPLPHEAAVDRMDMTCGERRVEGIVLEREEARDLYEQAKEEGKKAALLEQERDDLFTQSISNLCPGEEIEILLQWVQPVGYEDGTYSWAMPLTVGPRYTPPWVEDGDRITTPYDRDGQAVDVTVAIEEGMPVDGLWSDTHDIAVDDEGAWGAEVSIEGEASSSGFATIPNRDFELSWTLAGERPNAGIVTSRPDPDEAGWLALTIEPPELGPEFVARPRELVFVVDQSGSMSGEPYAAAVAAVDRALRGMRPSDTFNLVRFSDDAATLFDTSQPVSAGNREAAATWLANFTGGGTRMEVGLVEALGATPTPGALRLVVLLTDGYVGQDDEVMRLVKEHLGASRIFGFGVSSSPNRALFSRLSDVGRGAVVYHKPGRPIDEAVRTFEARIAHPAMTDLRVDWGGLEVSESYPSRLPDLWAGQPLRLYARYEGEGDATVRLTGMVGTRPYTLQLPVEVAPPDARHDAVINAWARAKIKDLTRRIGDPARERDAVVDVALDYGLVTRWTSLVAIDDEEAACGPAEVQVRVPHRLPVDHAGSSGIGGLLGARSTQIGSGGLGARGYGLGGGGTAEALAGFGTRGRGSGTSGYGSGGGNFGAKGEGAIGWIGGDAIILGSLDKSLVDSVIRRHLNQIRYCYQRELQKSPGLAGRLTARFVIAADGTVSESVVKSSTLANPAVEACVTGRIARMQFPASPGGGVQIVTYPFVFGTLP